MAGNESLGRSEQMWKVSCNFIENLSFDKGLNIAFREYVAAVAGAGSRFPIICDFVHLFPPPPNWGKGADGWK